MGWWPSSSSSSSTSNAPQPSQDQANVEAAVKILSETSPAENSGTQQAAQYQQRGKGLRYDYGESSDNKLSKDENLARPLPKEIKENPYKRNRGVFHEREEVNEPEREYSIFSQQRHPSGPFERYASTTPKEEKLDTWNNALFFFYRRPLAAVSLWGLSACFLSMVAGVALRRSTNDVVFFWGNATLAFKIATLGTLYYYNSNPPLSKLPASYVKYIREQQQALAQQAYPDVKAA